MECNFKTSITELIPDTASQYRIAGNGKLIKKTGPYNNQQPATSEQAKIKAMQVTPLPSLQVQGKQLKECSSLLLVIFPNKHILESEQQPRGRDHSTQ